MKTITVTVQSTTVTKGKRSVTKAKALSIIIESIICVSILVMIIVLNRIQTGNHTTPILRSTTMAIPTTDVFHRNSSTMVTSNYSSVLTQNDYTFQRIDDSNGYYYEAVQVIVSSSGNYSFSDMSAIDSYGYLYVNSFNPFILCRNRLTENDDLDDDTLQFQFEYALQSNITYILVFTTYIPRVTGEFLIIASGPATVKFLHINDTVPTIDSLLLTSTNEIINGIYNTRMGNNSIASIANPGPGGYPPTESPNKACDNNYTTKYLSFGSCEQLNPNALCGVNTGFYLTLKRGASVVTGLQVCTANDRTDRDPLTVTLEGSNQTGTDLTRGVNWKPIYSGPTGLYNDPDRSTCGITQFICNSIQYMSYRFLVTSKRATGNAVQYSEIKLLGY